MEVLNIAFYKFVDLENLPVWRERFRDRTFECLLRGTILLSPEGINGFLAGHPKSVREFQDWLKTIPEFRDIPYKESWNDSQPFTRMLVRLKKEIISMGMPEIKPVEKTGKRLTPAEFKQWLDEGREVEIVDTRNDYEIRLGTFQNARDLGLRTFREFPTKLADVAEELRSSKKPVVMFCTGGIRCEKATAVALNYGIEDVYQIDGGILKYFEDVGKAHYQGECFVFDHRVALGDDLRETRVVQCFNCRSPLTIEEQESADYVPAISCPYCADLAHREQATAERTVEDALGQYV